MAQTAKFDNRVAFQKLNADVLEEYHNGCRMLVYANNRFARNRADSVLYRGFYDRFGIVFDSVTEICPRGQDGVFITSIREVMAFPKNQQAQCLVTSAPGPVAEDQLEELGIATK